jgi:ADP-ribose pyrophosphatase YjhB (NUDIX family)
LRTGTLSGRVTSVIRLETEYGRALGVRPSVSAVIRDRSDRLLLQLRTDGRQWGLPGGSVEIGESVTEAVTREVLEETGLRVVVRRLVGIYSDPRLQVVRYPDGSVWHYVIVCFECAVRGGELTTGDETLDLRFFSPRRLPPTLLPHHRVRVRDAFARRAAPFVR